MSNEILNFHFFRQHHKIAFAFEAYLKSFYLKSLNISFLKKSSLSQSKWAIRLLPTLTILNRIWSKLKLTCSSMRRKLDFEAVEIRSWVLHICLVRTLTVEKSCPDLLHHSSLKSLLQDAEILKKINEGFKRLCDCV